MLPVTEDKAFLCDLSCSMTGSESDALSIAASIALTLLLGVSSWGERSCWAVDGVERVEGAMERAGLLDVVMVVLDCHL